MKNRFFKSCIFLLSFILAGSCSSPQENENETNTIPEDKYERNMLLLRSVNLGNALEAPNEGEWGVTIKEEYFELIKAAGFTGVRIPIRWSAHAATSSPYTIETTFLARVNNVIQQALQNDLAVVINIHHYEEIFSNPQAEKERFLAIWRQISGVFSSLPQNCFFEILNEPHDQLTAELWNTFLAEAINVIREKNPNRTLIIGTAEWGGLGALQKLVIPEEENNLILTVHYYSPFEFTHQGAEWVDGSNGWLGTTWQGTYEEGLAVKNEFSQIKAWADENDMPVYVGEFGAYSKAPMESRTRWTSFVSKEAERQGFSWAYWEFCSGFGVYDSANEEWNTELLNALIPER